MSRLSLLTKAVVLLPSLLFAENWSNWRGPTGNGAASTDAKPPIEWSETKNVKWKAAIPGLGSGSPVIWEDQVFVLSAVGKDGGRGFDGRKLSKLAFKIYSFDRETGKVRWEKTSVETTPHEGTHSSNGFASASCCTDGNHVYAFFGSRGLYCYTIKGDLVWKRDDFGKMKMRGAFGEGASPALEGDKILVPWDQEGPSAVFALNKLTGKTIWKTERDEPSAWSTPFVVEHDGEKQVILNGEKSIRSYDLETGKEIWHYAGDSTRPVATAVFYKDHVIVGGGRKSKFMGAFRLGGKGDLEGTKDLVWSWTKNVPDIPSPLISGDRLYFHKARDGQISCVDPLTGKAHYTASRLKGISSVYASPIAAGEHIYITGRSGTTVVIKDSEKLEIVKTNSVGEGVDATPAAVDKELFIRGEKHLFCIEESK